MNGQGLMKKIAFGLVLAMLQNCALANDHGTKLDKLGAALRYLRALPAGAKTTLRCPSHLENMHGVSIASVYSALGTPDHAAKDTHSYYLASPAPDGKRAGGFPVITFTGAKSGKVENVSCIYAK